MEPKVALEEAVAAWDRARGQELVATAEQERQEVLSRFPLSAWPELPLDRYALGVNGRNTFCWWMEFGTPDMGSIRGGSAKKHLIFRRSDGSGWYYVDAESYESVAAAWSSIRAGFVEAFDLAKQGRWADISRIYPLSAAATLSGKACYTYFADDLIPVYAHPAQEHFYHLLGGAGSIPSGAPGARRLLEMARERHEFRDWHPKEIEAFLYSWADPRDTRRIVKIAPGDNAKYWDDCRTNGYICVGWDEVGDLREFSSKEEFRARFGQVTHYSTEAKTSAKANELWTLFELEPGDVVIANQGTTHVLAIGTVEDPGYEWRDERQEYKHTVRVTWDESKARDIEQIKSWGTVTVAKVPNTVYDRILRRPTTGTTAPAPPAFFPPEKSFADLADALSQKGQAILYGPPGTGKTSTASRFAVWWLLTLAGSPESRIVLGDEVAFESAQKNLTTSQLETNVWWMVANPDEWAWGELFDDGSVEYRYGKLQKHYASVQPGDLVVGYQATPDKRVVALARVAEGLYTSPVDGEPKIRLEPLAKIPNGPTYEELTKDAILGTSEPIRNRNQGTLFALTPDEALYAVSLLRERNPSIPDVDAAETEIGPLTRVAFHPSYSYEDFVEGFKPVPTSSGQLQLELVDGIFKRVCRQALTHPKQTYLLIIDEINRGNIPKIFGELVTLLEMDKRGFTVLLPQSREPFQVPKNVRVIGTMNTADRSIKTLDAALRRRFAFVELMPDQEPLAGGEVDGLDLWVFLDGLNQRIAERVGREKQIGHSFLLEHGVAIAEPDEFARRFRQEILPLLQEYAYEDYAQLAEFIGPQLVDAKKQRLNQDKLRDPGELIDALKGHFQAKTDAADAG